MLGAKCMSGLDELIIEIQKKQSSIGNAATIEQAIFALIEDCVRCHMQLDVFYDLPAGAIASIRFYRLGLGSLQIKKAAANFSFNPDDQLDRVDQLARRGVQPRRPKFVAANAPASPEESRRAEIVRKVLPPLIRPVRKTGHGSSSVRLWAMLLMLAAGMRATEVVSELAGMVDGLDSTQADVRMRAFAKSIEAKRNRPNRNLAHALRKQVLADVADQLRPLIVCAA